MEFNLREDEIRHLRKDEIKDIHEDIAQSDEDTEPGVLQGGALDYIVSAVMGPPYGNIETGDIHDKAAKLMRLLAANHVFVDGNKRTALNATYTFYFLNGYYFDFGEEIKAVLKLYAVMERMVDHQEVSTYLSEICKPIEQADEIRGIDSVSIEYLREIATVLDEVETILEEDPQREDLVRAVKLLDFGTARLEELVEEVQSRFNRSETPVLGELIDRKQERLRRLTGDLEDRLDETDYD